MLFDGWMGLVRVVVVGSSAYIALIMLLRVSGKRTLAKLNAFDLVVTVALGSTLATVLLSSSVALALGVAALALLAGLQRLVAWGATRSRRVERLVKSEPALVYRGGFLTDAMRRERVTADELRQAARAAGHAELTAVAAIVLENDGSFSVLTDAPDGPASPSGPRAHGEPGRTRGP